MNLVIGAFPYFVLPFVISLCLVPVCKKIGFALGIYALDKIAPGTANDDTLLYGVEVKFYNMEVELDHNLMSCHEGLYIIGDGSGITHSLSHASASGIYVARQITSKIS